jgi:hypothetical protein
MRSGARWIVFGLLTLMRAASAAAEDGGRFDFGLRFNALGGNGEPTNDILGLGLVGRYPLSPRWRIAFVLDHADDFDFERPAVLLDLPPDYSGGDIDAKGTSTLLSAWIERVYAREGGRLEWFWAAGFGGGLVDIDDASGPLVGAGSYTITTEMDGELGVEEIIVGISGGLRIRFGERSALEVALRADRHIADWELLDLESGATGRVDDYLLRGATIGFFHRF